MKEGIQKYIMQVMVAVLIGVLSWLGNTVATTNTAVVELTVKVADMRDEIAKINALIVGVHKIPLIEQRLSTLESAFDAHIKGKDK